MILLGVQVLLVGYFIISQIFGGLNGRKQYGVDREKSALYGVYNVKHFVQNQDTLPPLLTDEKRWRRLLFDYPDFSTVMLMNDKVTRYETEVDTMTRTITFSLMRDTTNQYKLQYERTETELKLTGVLYGDTLEVATDYYDPKNFGLNNRGFHWVNEVPYNRYQYE